MSPSDLPHDILRVLKTLPSLPLELIRALTPQKSTAKNRTPRLYYHRLEGFQGLEKVYGIVGYAKRALVMAEADDIVLLDTYDGMIFPPPELKLLNEQSIGPKPENVFVVDLKETRSWEENRELNSEIIAELKKRSIEALLPFTGMSRIVHDLGHELGLEVKSAPYDVSKTMASKATFQEIGEKLGIIPRGFVCMDNNDVIAKYRELTRFKRCTGKAIVKAPFGSSGLAASVVRNEEELTGYLATHDVRIWSGAVIMEWIENDAASPSINFFLKEDKMTEFFISDQIFEEVEIAYGQDGVRIYRGNQYPSTFPYEILEELRKKGNMLAEAFRKRGFHGPLGIDAVIAKETGKVFLVEANSRITNPHYAWRPMKRFGCGAFRIQNEKLKKDTTVEKLREIFDTLIFSPEKKSGLIISNFYPGKFTSVVLATDRKELATLTASIDERLADLLEEKGNRTKTEIE